MTKPDMSPLIDLSCGIPLEKVAENHGLKSDVKSLGFQLTAHVVLFRKAVLTSLMDKAMDGDLPSIHWLEERGYMARLEPVKTPPTEDESDTTDS